jgi:MoaA/NifB/PqqE/SkfB family radical SAM enzyme
MNLKRLWPIDLTMFYLQRRVLRRTIPLLASFKVTYRCNLRCLACPFHLRAAQNEAAMSWERATAALDELKRRGTRLVVFEGGEPLLWRDGHYRLSDLLRYARHRFLRVAVTTNGTLPLPVEAHTLWVSLDGLKSTQDELRGGSFDRIYQNLKTTTHPRVYVHCTLNRRNLADIEELAELVSGMPTVRGMTVQFFYPYHQGEADLSLSPEERQIAVDRLLRLKERGYPILNSASCLRDMVCNLWRCHDDILINVDPDGSITVGCYAKNRGRVHCRECGFTPVAEASGALDLHPGSLLAGWKLFLR